MKESFAYRPVKDEIIAKKSKKEPRPLIASESDQKKEDAPLSFQDHFSILRQSIQEVVDDAKKPDQETNERIKQLNELLSPALMDEYRGLFKELKKNVDISEVHPQRIYIDIHTSEYSRKIERWVDHLVVEVRKKQKIGLTESDLDGLRMQCWLFFDSIATVMNTVSLEKDISEFLKNRNFKELKEKDQKKEIDALIKDLGGRYPIQKSELRAIASLVTSADEQGHYSPMILAKTIARLWSEYEMGKKKKDIAKISLGYFIAEALSSFSPSLYTNIMTGDSFNLAVALESMGIDKVSEVIRVKTQAELEKIMFGIRKRVNERMANSLFFQEFEFLHDRSLGDLFMALEKGKGATENLLSSVVSEFAPYLAGIAMSIAFLTKINPILGAISLGSIPALYMIAKKQGEAMEKMWEMDFEKRSKIATRLSSIKRGFEEIKTSPDSPVIAQHMREQYNAQDAIAFEMRMKRTFMPLIASLPASIATAVAAGVGYALNRAGIISGGAVLSNMIYGTRLMRPIDQLVRMYFDQFSRNIQDIQRMEKIFGTYESLDLPEGEREKERLPVSSLKSTGIVIKGLRYKEILRGLDLSIPQGDFVTITGASGAGKSTLLRNIVGLYKPNAGTIEIGGVETDKIKKYGQESIYSILAYCNQSPQIFEGMTLRENLLLWSREPVDDEKIKKILKDIHMEGFITRLDEEVKNLSGGEKVRIGVARTLLKGAKIMLLDEPTASLDSQSATEVRRVIKEINEKYPDTTIVCVSHDEDLASISKRTVHLPDLQDGGKKI